jgi:hypothetical protein
MSSTAATLQLQNYPRIVTIRSVEVEIFAIETLRKKPAPSFSGRHVGSAGLGRIHEGEPDRGTTVWEKNAVIKMY